MTGWQFGTLKMFGYDLLVADVPARFELYSEDTGSGKGAASQYDLMSVEELKALRVGELCRGDTLLLYWTTGWASAEGQAQEIVRSWGFRPKTELIWRKTTPAGKVRMGTGYRARTMHEPVLLCTLGNPKHKPFPSIFDGVAREHSRKPEEFYSLVDRCCPGLRFRADLFARTEREG